MILQIDENYRIRTDEHNFMLEKRRKERWFALCIPSAKVGQIRTES